jgi:hypothetical protein
VTPCRQALMVTHVPAYTEGDVRRLLGASDRLKILALVPGVCERECVCVNV